MPTAPKRRADPGLPKTRTYPHRANSPDPARLREKVARAIEGLIALLDTLDGDADLEDDEREPEADVENSLGATEGIDQRDSWQRPLPLDDIDLEDEHDGAEPDADDEPSLGATATIDQRKAWRRPFDDSFSPDREADDAEPLSAFLAAAH